VVVLAEGTDVLAAATNVLRFFRNESCGKCVPCRVGSAKAHEILRHALDSSGELGSTAQDRIFELEEVLRKTSICGLGQVALGPVVSVLGVKKGGTAARPHPKPEGSAGQPGP
jgi:formate dehydrogenase/NADH-quinone oxidoreductase subunit F